IPKCSSSIKFLCFSFWLELPEGNQERLKKSYWPPTFMAHLMVGKDQYSKGAIRDIPKVTDHQNLALLAAFSQKVQNFMVGYVAIHIAKDIPLNLWTAQTH